LALKLVILDDLECQNRGYYVFWQFWAATHILRVNCAEITTDGPERPAYEIFDIKHRLQSGLRTTASKMGTL